MSSVPKDKLDQALDQLDNWYENALKSGCGFKSDEERRQYIESLGDLEKHPMFAQTTEDLEGNPLAEALRAIREEDKTNIELAIMYKDEGNEWIKMTKDRKKALHEAYDRYAHAIKFLENEIELKMKEKASEEGKEAPAPPSKPEPVLRSVLYSNVNLLALEHQQLLSQLYSNRAAASFSLTNYGQCKLDCGIALSIWSENPKAWLRQVKSLHQLHKHQECIEASKAALETLSKVPTATKECEEISSLSTKSQEIVEKNYQKMKLNYSNSWNEKKLKWLTVYSLSQILHLKLSYFQYQPPEPLQLKDVWIEYHGNKQEYPFFPLSPTSFSSSLIKKPKFPLERELSNFTCPLLCLYPQYNQFDIIPDANISTMIAEYLAMIFPEFEDAQQGNGITWDINKEYQISNLVAYLSVSSGDTVGEIAMKTPYEWLISCLEYDFVYQNNSLDFFKFALKELIQDPTLNGLIQSDSTTSLSSILLEQGNRLKLTSLFEKYSTLSTIDELTIEDIQKIIKTTEETSNQKSIPSSTSSIRIQQKYYEIHLGCTIYQILQELSKFQGLSRGILSLVIFPRTSKAHRVFLQKNQKEGIVIEPLNP